MQKIQRKIPPPIRLKKVKQRFPGSIEVLKKLVADAGFIGEWRPQRISTGNFKHVFRGNDGIVLTFYASQTVQFQGKGKELPELEAAIGKYLVDVEPPQRAILPQKNEFEYDE